MYLESPSTTRDNCRLQRPADDCRERPGPGHGVRDRRIDTAEDRRTSPYGLLDSHCECRVRLSANAGHSGPIVGYVVAVAAAFALFMRLFKWQPWNSRLHLPLFFLFMPFVAMVVLQSGAVVGRSCT